MIGFPSGSIAAGSIEPQYLVFPGGVKIGRDGSVILPEDMNVDDASRIFWETVKQMAPSFFAEIKK